MSMNIRFPKITATNEAGQLQQMQSFMYQLVEQLNWALKTVESGTSGSTVVLERGSGSSGESSEKDTQTTFNSLKALIIKSADIVNAYYDKINTRLSGEYVAQSDFGTYTELTEQQIEATSENIKQIFANLQEIVTDIENVEHTLIEVNAYINSGLLYYGDDGAPVYGLEIGQRTEIDGEETFNKFARFTSDKLAFYDSNGNEVAYISDKKLYITHIEVKTGGSFTLGALVDTVLPDGSVVTK